MIPVNIDTLRRSWGVVMGRVADGEAVVLMRRGIRSVALLPPAVWEAARSVAEPAPAVVELGSSAARAGLGERRDAARRTGEHTLILDGNTDQPVAVLVPTEWAENALAAGE